VATTPALSLFAAGRGGGVTVQEALSAALW
jgi:hypothetical protein